MISGYTLVQHKKVFIYITNFLKTKKKKNKKKKLICKSKSYKIEFWQSDYIDMTLKYIQKKKKKKKKEEVEEEETILKIIMYLPRQTKFMKMNRSQLKIWRAQDIKKLIYLQIFFLGKKKKKKKKKKH